MVSQTTHQAKSLTALSAAMSPLLWIGRTLTALVQEVWQIANLIDHRQQLSRLGDRDDRMLADIGLSRCDLTTARSAPLWRDPTAMLKRRVNEPGAEKGERAACEPGIRRSLSPHTGHGNLFLPVGNHGDRHLLRTEQT